MSTALEFVVRSLAIGVGATMIMDLWAFFLRRAFGVPSLDYGMVGRWIGHWPRGRFRHDAIASATAISGERFVGWSAHYLIGIAFAALLLSIWGLGWARQPTLLPALVVGVGTVVMPFFVMQPGMGAGIAASRTPNPAIARVRSLMAHASFGVGLYVAGLLTAAVWPLLPTGS